MPRFEPHPQRRVAVVTGASSGIGQATARALAGAGHPVVLGARRLERLESVAEEIRAAGGEAVALRLDVADAGSVDAFVKAAIDAAGSPDVVVSCAGQFLPYDAADPRPEDFDAVVEVNLLGAHRLVAAV